MGSIKVRNSLLSKRLKRTEIRLLIIDDNQLRYNQMALLHKDLKCKAPLIEPNLRRNLGKWST